VGKLINTINPNKALVNKKLDALTVREFRINTRGMSKKKFVDKLYLLHKNKLEKLVWVCKKKWEKKSKLFFLETSIIFKDFPWPSGKYVGFLSFFNKNPSFLNDSKTSGAYFSNCSKATPVML
jgi:hypothetical protein